MMKKFLMGATLVWMMFSAVGFDNFVEAVTAGDKALAEGRKDEAVKCYVAGADMLGSSPELTKIILKLQQLGKWQDIANIYKRLSDENPAYLRHYYRVSSKSGPINIDDAIAKYTEISAKTPAFLERKWHWMLQKKEYGKVYAEAFAVMNDTAFKVNVRVKACAACTAALRGQGKVDESITFSNEQLVKQKFSDVYKMNILKQNAFSLRSLKRYEDSVRAFGETAKLNVPNCYKAQLLCYQAQTYNRYLHDPETARKSLDKAMKLDAKEVARCFTQIVKAVDAALAKKKATTKLAEEQVTDTPTVKEQTTAGDAK